MAIFHRHKAMQVCMRNEFHQERISLFFRLVICSLLHFLFEFVLQNLFSKQIHPFQDNIQANPEASPELSLIYFSYENSYRSLLNAPRLVAVKVQRRRAKIVIRLGSAALAQGQDAVARGSAAPGHLCAHALRIRMRGKGFHSDGSICDGRASGLIPAQRKSTVAL